MCVLVVIAMVGVIQWFYSVLYTVVYTVVYTVAILGGEIGIVHSGIFCIVIYVRSCTVYTVYCT